MHNAKCIMHNYMFLFVGAAIGSPFVGYVTVVGRLAGGRRFVEDKLEIDRFPHIEQIDCKKNFN